MHSEEHETGSKCGTESGIVRFNVIGTEVTGIGQLSGAANEDGLVLINGSVRQLMVRYC